MAQGLKLQHSLGKPDIISHRGNLDGPNKDRENHPDYLEAALKAGYGIEFDVWYENGQWALGHDEPKYAVTFDYLLNLGTKGEGYNHTRYPRTWIHLKNLGAVQEMISINSYGRSGRTKEEYQDNFSGRQIAMRLNYFWHQEDDITITNHGWIWAHPKVEIIPVGSAWVASELLGVRKSGVYYDFEHPNWTRAAYVCLDYPNSVRDLFTKLRQSSEYFAR